MLFSTESDFEDNDFEDEFDNEDDFEEKITKLLNQSFLQTFERYDTLKETLYQKN